ncbi:serine/threonine protein kinase [Laspinema sp. D1]|uniref:Serine/threonine protein kinase n=1 Tax=Laspinema palackyanum D2a TaxID=2953684 RepID=A0ABT2MPE5_9CYAN|nr:serine/threonine protein kinase [Laspinema sp. D2a]
MSLCINPHCRQPDRLDNINSRYCQSCGSDLLLNGLYRVKRLLSDRSGFGNIYEVFEQGTPKILKVLKSEWNSNAKAVELFKREAEVLRQLSHPGIPQVESYFQYQTQAGFGLHCIVMEKIDGLDLEQWLGQQKNPGITQEQAIKWLKEIAKILQIVHEKQFFHRDIKPANIMIRPNGRLVLIDFGTARQETYTYLAKVGGVGGVTSVTSAGYTPPEQQNAQAVPQSDFFALGRTFLHLLTGQHPLKFYDAHQDELNWRAYLSGISPLLLDFIDNLMERIPSKRPMNTQALLHRIEELEKKLITAPNPPRTNPKMTLPFAVATGLLILVGLGGVSGYKYLQANPCVIKKATYCVNTLVNTLAGHSGWVWSVAISPDGQTLVSASNDKTIKIWNLANGNLIRTLAGHSRLVNSVAISPDGQTLVSGSADGTIKIWNLSNGELIRTLAGHSNSVSSVAISPDGQTFVSGSYDNTIKIWNLANGELIGTLAGHSSYVYSVAISPDGQTLVSGSHDNTIKIWNLANGELIGTLAGHSSYVYSVAISPDGQTFVSGSYDKTIKIWNLSNGNLIRTLAGHSSYVYSVTISPDGQTLVSGSWDNTIKIWNLSNGNLIHTLAGHSDYVSFVAISPDGQTIVSGSQDGTINIWRGE